MNDDDEGSSGGSNKSKTENSGPLRRGRKNTSSSGAGGRGGRSCASLALDETPVGTDDDRVCDEGEAAAEDAEDLKDEHKKEEKEDEEPWPQYEGDTEDDVGGLLRANREADEEEVPPPPIHWTGFRDQWNDSTAGRWKTKVERRQTRRSQAPRVAMPHLYVDGKEQVGEGTPTRSTGSDGSARAAQGSAGDDLGPEIARLRRKLRLRTAGNHDKPSDDHHRPIDDDGDDVEMGHDFDGESTDPTAQSDVAPKLQRPGAYRMRRTVDDGVDASSDDEDEYAVDELGRAARPPANAMAPVLPPQRTLGDRVDTLLLEANLVDESDQAIHPAPEAPLVKAQRISRMRQFLAVAGLNLSFCMIVALVVLALAVLFTVVPPSPFAHLNLTYVESLQAEFNRTLPAATLTAIDLGSTPQAKAYDWIFGSGGHPGLPASTALVRMLHRFALATLYYSTTEGESKWKKDAGWLDAMSHECLWEGVYCRNLTVTDWNGFEGVANIYSVYDDESEIDALDLSYNRLVGTIPGEISLLLTANVATLRLELNALTGTIPAAIGNLTTLQDLSLLQNQLTGSLPPTLGNLSRLVSLSVSDNQLTGSIPSELGRLSSLTSLELSDTLLSGPVPDDICGFAASHHRVLNVTVNCDRVFDCSCCTCTS